MRISVIIPAFENARTIERCVESVFRQVRKPDEVIVVNDGSTDDTLARIAKFKDRITLIDQDNQGGNAARNAGFEGSSGERVIFCDADVVMKPSMLSALSQALDDHPESSYAYCGFRFGFKSFSSYAFDADRLKRMNYIHTTSLIRRKDFPGFDKAIKRLQDWDVWLTMLEEGKTGVFVDQELFEKHKDTDRKGISQWRPSFMYSIPWRTLGWMPESMRKYEEAKRILFDKHGL